MAKLVAYEVQTYQRGDWQIDSIVNDRASAMDSARDFEKSKHCAGVRVVEEVHDEDSQNTATKIIYRYTKSDGPPQAPRARPTAAAGARKPAAKPKNADFKAKAYASPAAKRDNSTAMAVGTLLVLSLVLAVGYFLATR